MKTCFVSFKSDQAFFKEFVLLAIFILKILHGLITNFLCEKSCFEINDKNAIVKLTS